MNNWKDGILSLSEWINFQKLHNENLHKPTLEAVTLRIWDMIFGITLEELKQSEDRADIELYNERIKNGEIEFIK